MEIVSYVLDGELAHKDSMGNGTGRRGQRGVIRPGDVQRMSAGTGVMHSEFNHAPDRTTHFLQIWIMPKFRGIEPGYEQKHFDADESRGRLRPWSSHDARDGSVSMNADASIFAGLFDGDEAASAGRSTRSGRPTSTWRAAARVNGSDFGAAMPRARRRVAALNLTVDVSPKCWCSTSRPEAALSKLLNPTSRTLDMNAKTPFS